MTSSTCDHCHCVLDETEACENVDGEIVCQACFLRYCESADEIEETVVTLLDSDLEARRAFELLRDRGVTPDHYQAAWEKEKEVD